MLCAGVRISSEGHGFSRTALKDLISRQRVYDLVLGNLPTELKYTRIEDGKLTGDRRGRYKEYEQDVARLKALQALSDEYHGRLSRTKLINLEKEREKLLGEHDKMSRAKRYYAYSLAREMELLQKELAAIGGDQVEACEEKTREYIRLSREKNRLEEILQKNADTEKNYAWLKEAGGIYDRYLAQAGNPLQGGFLVAAAVSLAAALGMFFYLPRYAYIPLALSFIFMTAALVFTFVVKKVNTRESALAGMEAMEKDFYDRFGRRLNSRADLEAALGELEKKNWELESRRREVGETEHSLGRLASDLETLYAGLGIEGSREKRPALLRELKNRLLEKEKRIAGIQGIIDSLAVDVTDYLAENPGVKYSRGSEDRCAERTREIERETGEELEQFDSVVRRLTDHIDSDTAYSSDIEKISLALTAKLDEYRDNAASNYALMVAGHLVNGVISDFQAEEDERLTEYLNSGEMTSLLARITGHYHGFAVEGEDIHVVSNRGTYNIRDLSTGARDQIMLILRTGIARAVTGSETMFLVLDDAFQYSDWERRDRLVHEVITLVNEGWQVIYLTMDNDIRERFNRAGRSLPKGSYKYIEL